MVVVRHSNTSLALSDAATGTTGQCPGASGKNGLSIQGTEARHRCRAYLPRNPSNPSSSPFDLPCRIPGAPSVPRSDGSDGKLQHNTSAVPSTWHQRVAPGTGMPVPSTEEGCSGREGDARHWRAVPTAEGSAWYWKWPAPQGYWGANTEWWQPDVPERAPWPCRAIARNENSQKGGYHHNFVVGD